MTRDGVIGKANALAWNIPEDLQHFKRLTTGHPVIMGRLTFESIGRPLPNRVNIVLSRTQLDIPGVHVCKSFQQAIDLAHAHHQKVFVIGGVRVYEQALTVADRLCVSWVKGQYEGDTYFPDVHWDDFEEIVREEHDAFTYVEYARKPRAE